MRCSSHSAQRSRLEALWLLFAAGCSAPEPEFIAVERPEGARSLLVLQTDRLYALESGFAQSAEPPVFHLAVRSEPHHLHALWYRESLDELGLEEGPVGPPSRCARSCALLRPLAAHTAAMAEDGWVTSAATPQALTALWDQLLEGHAEVCIEAPCLRLESRLVALGTRSQVEGSAPLEGGAAWVVLGDGNTRVVHADGGVQEGCSLPTSARSTWLERDDRGWVWIARDDGPLVALEDVRTREPGPCVFARSVPAPNGIAFKRLAITQNSETQLELHALGIDRALWRYDGADWRELGRFFAPRDPELRGHGGGVVALDSGLIVTFDDTLELLVADRDQVSLLEVPQFQGSGRITSGRTVDGLGLVLSSEGAGLVTVGSAAERFSLHLAVPWQGLAATAPAREHLMVASRQVVEAWHTQRGVCDFAPVENVSLLTQLIPLEGTHAFLLANYSPVVTGEGPQTPREALIIDTKLPCE